MESVPLLSNTNFQMNTKKRNNNNIIFLQLWMPVLNKQNVIMWIFTVFSSTTEKMVSKYTAVFLVVFFCLQLNMRQNVFIKYID